jgi:predicted O-linked N-acetylglucosamine transferase (SPINDLY family)
MANQQVTVLSRAIALADQGENQLAQEILTTAIAQTQHADVRVALKDALATVQFRSGQFEQSLQTLHELIDQLTPDAMPADSQGNAAQYAAWPQWAQSAWSGVASSALSAIDLPRLWRNTGACHMSLTQPKEAEHAFAQAYLLNPKHASNLVYHYGQSMANCEWSRWQELREEVIAGVLRSSAHDDLSPSIALFSVAEHGAQMHALSQHVARFLDSQCDPVLAKRHLPLRKSIGRSRIKVGYFSCDLRSHVVGQITQDIFALHDRERFEIFALSYGLDDGSPVRVKIAQEAEHFVPLQGHTASQMVQQIRELDLDVVVDLSGLTAGALPQVMHYRVAPIQCHWLGYLWSMGSKAYDYVIADQFSVPQELYGAYHEAVVALPHTLQLASPSKLKSHVPKTREELGLRDDAFVMAYFGALSKLTPTMFDAWLDVLRQAPHAVLWIGRNAHSSPEAFGRLRFRAMQTGIHPAQMVFSDPVSHEVHLARYAAVDVVLDPYPVGSGVTAVEALWMGCPIVSMAAAGETLVSRMPGGVLHAAGLGDWVVDSLQAYQAQLLRAAHDSSVCAKARAHLSSEKEHLNLFDTKARVRQLEAAYETMLRTAQAGKPSQSFALSA